MLELTTNNQLLGAFNEAGTCTGLSGNWVRSRLYSGKYLEANNLVENQDYRPADTGKPLSDRMLQEAQRLKRDAIMTMAYVTTSAVRRLYTREGFHIKSHHFYNT